MSRPVSVREWLREIYFGESARARQFRYGLISFDLVTLNVFLLSSFGREEWWMMPST